MRMLRNVALVAAVVCAFLPGCGSSQKEVASAGMVLPSPAVKKGHAVFAQHCNVCHPGGGKGVGPSLIKEVLRPQEIKDQVRKGKGLMPAFSPAQISDQDLDELAAYLIALWKHKK